MQYYRTLFWLIEKKVKRRRKNIQRWCGYWTGDKKSSTAFRFAVLTFDGIVLAGLICAPREDVGVQCATGHVARIWAPGNSVHAGSVPKPSLRHLRLLMAREQTQQWKQRQTWGDYDKVVFPQTHISIPIHRSTCWRLCFVTRRWTKKNWVGVSFM